MQITEIEKCTGCGACYQICPFQAISMAKNSEGFRYPQIDIDLCKNCGLCVNVCPINKKTSEEDEETEKQYYLAYAKDENVRKIGSSGGIFGLIARRVLQRGGVVYGASYDDCLSVHVERIDNVNDLRKILKSKYVQCNTEDIFSRVKEDLENGLEVLYSGTSCQISGLRMFLGKNYSMLHTVDIVCHGVPSEDIFKSWLNNYEIKYKSKVKFVDFRNKEYNGWNDYTIVIELENGKKVWEKCSRCAYMQALILDYSIRNSCYNCIAKKQKHADITLGDFWNYDKQYGYIDDKGISLVVCNNEKGRLLINDFLEDIVIKPATEDKALESNPLLFESANKPSGRDKFISQIIAGKNFKATFFKMWVKYYFTRILEMLR